ncbi:hypothetical protein JB92DRAFT_1737840 [Gautieria morchelliformis]|nr:hypothetical protein JB92DRAFT_1737840 [Gautieria morchelliformis]
MEPPLSISMAIFELALISIYFGLALYKFVRHVRERSRMVGYRAVRNSGNITSILSLILRDSILFYAMIFATILACAVLFSSGSQAASVVPWLIGCYSVAGSRLVLTLYGNPNDALGIYNQGTELWVSSRLTVLDEASDVACLEHSAVGGMQDKGSVTFESI